MRLIKFILITLFCLAGLFVNGQIDHRNNTVRQIANGDTIVDRIFSTYDYLYGSNPLWLINYQRVRVSGKLEYPNITSTAGKTKVLVMDGDTIKEQLIEGATPAGTNGSIQLNYDNALYASPQLSFDTTKMAFTAGYRTGTVGDISVVLGGAIDGEENIASGNFSTAMGVKTTASGECSAAIGYNSTSSGPYSIAVGESSIASGSTSTAMGIGTRASGAISTAMGYKTISHDFSETAIGHFSTTSTGDALTFLLTNNAFKIGNGTSGSPSDCFKVDFSGNTTITGNAIVEDSVKTNHIEPLTSNDTLSIGHNVVIIEGRILFDGNLGNSVLHPDTIFATAQNINGINTFFYSGDVADDATILLPTNINGHGIISVNNAGTNTASAYFEFSNSGAVHLSTNLNAVNSDTDGQELCIFDNGIGVAIRFRSGSARNTKITIWY